MTDEERQRRVAALLAEERQAEPRWYYLSFASEKGFLGVCWVKAGGLITAIQIAHARGINPGGQVSGVPLPFQHDPPGDSAYKLYRDRAEIEQLCQAWGAMESNQSN